MIFILVPCRKLRSLCRVCRKFMATIQDDQLWSMMLKRDFPHHKPIGEGFSAQQYYGVLYADVLREKVLRYKQSIKNDIHLLTRGPVIDIKSFYPRNYWAIEVFGRGLVLQHVNNTIRNNRFSMPEILDLLKKNALISGNETFSPLDIINLKMENGSLFYLFFKSIYSVQYSVTYDISLYRVMLQYWNLSSKEIELYRIPEEDLHS